MHPQQHQGIYYPAQPPTTKTLWDPPSPSTAIAPTSTSHTLQRPYSHGPDGTDAPSSSGARAPHSTTAAMWTAPATLPGPGAPGTSARPYQSPASLAQPAQNYPPSQHLPGSSGGPLIGIGNPEPAPAPALQYPSYPSRAMDATQYVPLQGGGGGGGGAMRNQGGRPSSSVVATHPVAGHPYAAHSQGVPPYSLRHRSSGMGMPTGRRHLRSRTARADDGSDGEYGDSDVDLEGPMKRTDGHNLSTHERRRLYVSALETYITDTTNTMRSHGLEPPLIQRCVDNRGLTSDARLTMMATLDDEIKHLQHEIEEAENQRRQLQLQAGLALRHVHQQESAQYPSPLNPKQG